MSQAFLLPMLCGHFEPERRVRCGASSLPSRPSDGSGLLLRIVFQDALSEVMKVYPPMTLKVVCGRYDSNSTRAEQGIARRCGAVFGWP